MNLIYMKRYATIIIFIALAMLSCNKKRVFTENKDIASNFRWEKNHSIEFTPQISDVSAVYKIYFVLRHVYGFKLQKFNIKIILTPPSGKAVKKIFTIPVFDQNNKSLSDCSGDYCDLETLIEENFKFFETGKHQFKITYDMDIDFLPNIMQVGLIIDKK